MELQKWILHNILNLVPAHPASFAYERKRSVKQCASKHCGAKWLLKLDLHDFFHSIDERQAYAAVRNLGYSPLVAFELSRICTRLIGHSLRPSGIINEKYVITAYHSDRLGFLPQGAPTSGKLANLVARRLDDKLQAIAAERGVVYTRYADDLIFSSAEKFDRKAAMSLLCHAKLVVERSKFSLHKKKTQIVSPGARKIVLGLMVDLDRPRLPPFTKRRIENHVRGSEKFGVVAHRLSRNFSSTWGFVAHVWGLLSFALDVDPYWAGPIRDRWRAVLIRDGWSDEDFRPDLFVVDSYMF